ncbi:MAG: hypothetical protein Q4D65_07355 [Peptostreptococcaceae bacterium]|nr:hypothetical protein [Peptostreptococcaceae bacterium]
MRNKKIRGLAVFLLMIFLAVGCTKKEEQSKNETTEPKPSIENKNLSEETNLFWNDEEDFSVKIPKRFVFQDKETVEDGTSGMVYRFSTEDGETLEISDLLFPDEEVNEALLEEEMKQSEELEIIRVDNMEVDEGQFYGLLVEDKASGNFMFYHRIKRDDRIISFLQIKPEAFSEEDEIENKTLLRSIRYSY